MSRILKKLQDLERERWSAWWLELRNVDDRRRACLTAPRSEKAEKRALLTMAIANAERSYNEYLAVCQSLDDIEIESNWGGNGRGPDNPE